ncbi:MAG: pentapeptide repeat-containing protein, partial [Acaryochloris sp. SU_5_25]|nr:pentapeptide repeat-containing protein [Acaryochloris sp. SU_5_25]
MKSITLSTTVTLAIMGMSLPAQALEADLVKKLQDTRSCAGCNLSNANLSGLDLRQANLQGANLSNA